MARKKQPGPAGFVLFDIVYDDGSRSSNRKVPDAELNGPDGDKSAKYFVEAQDRQVAEKSGKAPGRIKSILRSARRPMPDAMSKGGMPGSAGRGRN